MRKMKSSMLVLLTSLFGINLLSCTNTNTSNSSFGEEPSQSSEKQDGLFDDAMDLTYRQNRDFSAYPMPATRFDESTFPALDDSMGHLVSLNDQSKAIITNSYRLDFVLNESGKYFIQIVDCHDIDERQVIQKGTDRVMFINETPVQVYVKGNNESFKTGYDQIIEKEYGYQAIAKITTSSGSVFQVTDCYYFPKEKEKGSINISSMTEVLSYQPSDVGFANEYSFSLSNNHATEWFVPNNIFKNYNESSSSRIFKETQLGLPMMMMRDKTNGYILSMARYQPIIHYQDNSYATLQLDNTSKAIAVAYPSNEANRKYHEVKDQASHVYEMSIFFSKTNNYEEASSLVYNTHFNLQNQRIVNTDIDEVYKVINEDYKTFLHEEEQYNEETGKKYKSYGLPWRITIEDGEFGPYTYQAGFIGQQIPSAYNMMLYGLMNDDLQSFENGINVVDFWVEDAEMMSIAGVPHIWYDTWADDFRAYPCFLRMAVDAMEGLLDAYRLVTAHGMIKDSWLEALQLFAEFLVNNQNEDGSYYRCYNYDGGPFYNWDNGIEEPPNNICQSESKSSSPMPIRFLGKMYEMTGNEIYKEAALKAGQFVYENLYQLGYYQGGTCDNPNAIDKEAGVYAMYAYDTLYTLTKDEKWLICLKQAASFTMSTVLVVSYPVKTSNLKSAYALYSGYNDGLSFISCNANSGVDNYISYIYYELFRIYILTGEISYLKQAEFIQQNTKSVMNWDGTLNYKYKSLVAEASSISTFTYSSASDGAWVTWSSVANAEPIAKMYVNFGCADVAKFKNTDLTLLRNQLQEVGCGGKEHLVFENKVVH